MTSDAQPLVSIVIPMRNEKAYIDRCIQTFIQQTYPLEQLEIIIVDGQSTDGSREIVEELGKLYPVKLFDNPTGFTPTGMNIGLQSARGEIGVVFSAHATAHPDFIKNSVQALKNTNAAAVGGRLINRSTGEFAKLAGKVLGHPFGVGNSKFRYSDKADYVDTVAYGAYRMDVLKQTGLFDERLIRNQDIELNYRLRKFGHTLYFDPSIESYYAPREDFTRFVQQGYGNGYWNIITARLCAQSLSWRHFIPLVFVLALLGATLLSILTSPWWLALVAGPYLLLDLLVSMRLAGSLPEFFQLVLLFPSLHISYGFGSLVSLVKQIFTGVDKP
ncbi:MAG: glycosyltransferase [Desulfitobacterium sp.]